jgi:hypothetical protein
LRDAIDEQDKVAGVEAIDVAVAVAVDHAESDHDRVLSEGSNGEE